MRSTTQAAAAQVRALQDDPTFDRLRTRGARRGLVVAAFVALAGVVAAAAADAPVLLIIAAVPTLAAGWALRRVVRLTADAPDEALDERLVAVRDDAYRHAWTILVPLTMTVLLLLYVAADARRIGLTLQADHVHALFWWVTGAGALLPSAVVAWRAEEV
jgi:hypothetical protein